MHRKVVIIIDDTDRKGKDELMEMFKIIRLTANFKNVFFIVTYDKDYVVQQIKNAGLNNGTEYLKKIFPLEITLPLVENNVLPKLFRVEIKDGFDENFTKIIIEQIKFKFEKDEKPLLSHYIKSFRDVKNFVNTLS